MSAIDAVLKEKTIETLACGYVFFLEEVNRAQHLYEKSGRYEYSRYQDVYHQTYDNHQFMSLYHWGVLAITFLWEHHLRIFEFFRDRFLAKYVPEGSALADFGSGAGVWSLIASHYRLDIDVTGIDISKSSFDLANRLAAAAGVGQRVRFLVADALKPIPLGKPCDACVSCFLQEHLENPSLLLDNLANHLAPGKFAFVTTAITAAEIDHIFEFRQESEVVALAEKSGFRVVELLSQRSAHRSAESSFPASLDRLDPAAKTEGAVVMLHLIANLSALQTADLLKHFPPSRADGCRRMLPNRPGPGKTRQP